MEKVKFGIIGIGNMGSAHAVMSEKIPNVELVAVCDKNEKAFDRLPANIREKVPHLASSGPVGLSIVVCGFRKNTLFL